MVFRFVLHSPRWRERERQRQRSVAFIILFDGFSLSAWCQWLCSVCYKSDGKNHIKGNKDTQRCCIMSDSNGMIRLIDKYGLSFVWNCSPWFATHVSCRTNIEWRWKEETECEFTFTPQIEILLVWCISFFCYRCGHFPFTLFYFH